MKEILKIYTEVGNGANDPIFRDGITISEYTYSSTTFNVVKQLSATLYHNECLDDFWTRNEYVSFKGTRYYIRKVPTWTIENTDTRYKYDVQFVSEAKILEDVYWYDTYTAGYPTYYSESTKVMFMGDLKQFVARMNAALNKSIIGGGWTIAIAENVPLETKLVSMDKVYFSDALKYMYDTFNVPYYIVGKTIYVGLPTTVLPFTFEYGMNKGLYGITKTQANFRPITRITGIGSTENIPYHYPNRSGNREEVQNWIEPQPNLLPPLFRASSGKEKFYNAINNTYPIPHKEGEYYFFENIFNPKAPSEHVQPFDEIKPTIQGMTYNSLPIDVIESVGYDVDDNDNINHETGDIEHPYFKITLNPLGFDLFKSASARGEMTISMRNGACGACNFRVMVEDSIKVSTIKDEITGEDIYPDSTNRSVTLTLEKDIETYGTIMPNQQLKVSSGNKFIILYIDLPQSFIDFAEIKLYNAIIKHLSENNKERFNFSVKFDEKLLRLKPEIENQIAENTLISIRYKSGGKNTDGLPKYVTVNLNIQSITIKQTDKDWLPSYQINLTDNVTITSNSMDNVKDKVDIVDKEVVDNKNKNDNNARRTLKALKDAEKYLFDPDGKIKEERLSAKVIQGLIGIFGTDSGAFYLSNTKLSININGNPNEINFTNGELHHYLIKWTATPIPPTDPITPITETNDDDNNFIWNIAPLIRTDLVSNKNYYVYVQANRTNNSSQWYIGEEQIIYDSKPDVYYFLVGQLLPVDQGYRSQTFSKGLTYISGGDIRTGLVSSFDGLSYLNLDDGSFRVGDNYTYISWNENNLKELKIKGVVSVSPSGEEFPNEVYRGEYNSWYYYYKGDKVTYNGSSYLCIAFTKGNIPTNVTYWDLTSAKGDNGERGKDGTDYEFIFTRTTSDTKPTTPATSQEDDYIPANWTDDAVGVNPTYQYEWTSRRYKINGVWSVFSTSALWAKYSFDGSDGSDGKSGKWMQIRYIYSDTKPETPNNVNISSWLTIPSQPEKINILYNHIQTTMNSELMPFSRWYIKDGKFISPDAIGNNYRSKAMINFTSLTDNQTITLLCDISCENIADYMLLGNLDSKVSNLDYNYKIYSTTSGVPKLFELTINVPTKGEHYLELEYVTDKSIIAGRNNVIVKVDYSNRCWFTESLSTYINNNWVASTWSKPELFISDNSDTESIYWLTNTNLTPDIPISQPFIDKYIPPLSVQVYIIWEPKKELSSGSIFIYQNKYYEAINDILSTDIIFPLNKVKKLNDWTDNPTGVSSENIYEWISIRKKNNNIWGTFYNPSLWSKFGLNGDDGNYTEYRYRINGSNIVSPIVAGSEINYWSTTIPTILLFQYCWVTTALKKADGTLIESWSTPSLTNFKGEGGTTNLIIKDDYSAGTTYYGNSGEVNAVYVSSSRWYISRSDAPNSQFSNVDPTNTSYWNIVAISADSIATNLLLAKEAYIKNLGVENLKTAKTGARIEITHDSGKLDFYTDTDTVNNPTLELKSGIDGGTVGLKIKTANGRSYLSENGVFVNSSQGNVAIAPSTGFNIVGGIASIGNYTVQQSLIGARHSTIRSAFTGTASNTYSASGCPTPTYYGYNSGIIIDSRDGNMLQKNSNNVMIGLVAYILISTGSGEIFKQWKSILYPKLSFSSGKPSGSDVSGKIQLFMNGGGNYFNNRDNYGVMITSFSGNPNQMMYSSVLNKEKDWFMIGTGDDTTSNTGNAEVWIIDLTHYL